MVYLETEARLFLRMTMLMAFVVMPWLGERLLRAQEESMSSSPGVENLPSPTAAPPAPAPARANLDEASRDGATTSSDGFLESEYEVLLQGPVHEAFATTVDADPALSARSYSEKPPNPIVETPPDEGLLSDEMIWIPGYWAWSDETREYIWVSGLYRRPPPGRIWVPGLWSQHPSGYRWTAGYWGAAEGQADNLEYLPTPPESIDNGPSAPPPGDNYFWVPGHWEYAGSQYQWESGFWSQHQEGWVWQPACYINTPKGYVSIDGYWDVLPPQRGQLYAPVGFSSPVFSRPNYVYTPRFPLASTALMLHLFTRPGYRNFYHGDYYDPRYADLGYLPWYSSGNGRGGFNSPWVGYYDWNYRRSGIDFISSMQRYDDFFRANTKRRPPKSFQLNRSEKYDPFGFASPTVQGPSAGRSLDELVRREVGGKPPKQVEAKIESKSKERPDNFGGKDKRGSGNSQLAAPPGPLTGSPKFRSSQPEQGSPAPKHTGQPEKSKSSGQRPGGFGGEKQSKSSEKSKSSVGHSKSKQSQGQGKSGKSQGKGK